MAHVQRHGITELHPGVIGDDVPLVNIIFVHGLWGNPRTTWETDAAPTTSQPARLTLDSPSSLKNSFGNIIRGVGIKKKQTYISTSSGSTNSSSGPSNSLRLYHTEQLQPSVPVTMNLKKCYWPHDLLPSDIPRARILTYGYDADVIGTSRSSETDILSFTRHGQDLLVHVEREVHDKVPIIFCAHSLGGIIVKDALHRSKTNLSDRMKRVHELTKCVVFLGTPHRGSRMANWSDIFTKIAKLAMLDMRRKLVRDLRIDSEILKTIHSEFVKMLFSGDFYVHSFQERKKINENLGKVVDDFSSQFDENPMQVVETIDASHRDMVRFRSHLDHGYRQVVGVLRKHISLLAPIHDAERVSIATSFATPLVNAKTIFSVPYSRNPNFVGREKQIEEIEQHFAGPNKTNFVALHGLGGMGKSQVALELAYRWNNSFPKQSILWIHAGTEDRLEQSFRDILTRLGIMDTREIDAQRLVGNWLQDEATGPWLMIVDNVDSEDVMCENNDGQSTVTKLLSCIPRVDNGSVLFTGRHRMTALKLADEVISLNELTEGEAIELLKRTLKNDNVSYEDAKALIDELGYIPLVINHAASFIRENDSDILSYLELYHENEEECIELLGGDVSDEHNSSSSDIPKSVLRTWSVSFNHLEKDPTAGRLPRVLLSIMSFVDRQEIPKSALYFFDKKALKVHYEKAFGTLKNMSLITQSGDRTFSMHRLVQLSMRRWLKQQGTDRDFADKAVSLLAEAFPDGSLRTWKECSDLIVHAETVLSHAMDSTEPLARARLLSNVAAFQSNRGQYSAAEVKYEQVVKLKTQVQGPEHPETMDAIDLLALIMRREARYSEAEELALQTLAVRERLFDREHVETLKSAQIIATLHGDRGNHKLAEEQNRSIWEIRQRILGSEHLDTLQSAANLSISLWELGKYSEAEKLAREVLTARENALGEESTETLEIADTLGFIVEVQGKYTQAEALKRHILEIRERVLGGDHPDTAGSLHDLAWILHQQGRYLEAGDYYDRAIQLKLKLLGEDHPTTLTTMCNVPVFFGDKGRYEEAENASRRILQKWEKIRGPEHPQTLDALGDYAVVLRHLGKLDAAAQAAQKSISGRERAFREDHPWTLPTVVQLGYILTLQGECSRGEKIIRTALTGLEKELGKDHPYVYTGMICLSKNLLIQKQKLEEAETLSRQALDGRKRILGTRHPYTFKTMYHHSLVLLAREQFLEAEAMCRCALDGMQTTLGSEHPDVTRCDKDYSRIIEQMALLQSPQMKIIGVGYIDLEGAEFN